MKKSENEVARGAAPGMFSGGFITVNRRPHSDVGRD
jgi:hypothetical protein